MSKCSCGCAEGKCKCKPGCKCGCNHKKGGASWAQKKSFEKAWEIVKNEVRSIVCDNCVIAASDMITEHSFGPFASEGDEENLDPHQIAREMGEMLPDHICEMRDDPGEWKLAGLRCVCGCNR